MLGVIYLIAGYDKNVKDEIIREAGKYHGVLLYCIDLIINLVSD